MDTNGGHSRNRETVDEGNPITNRTDSIFLRENINRFSEQLFMENTRQFSRYDMERRWPSIVRSSDDGTRRQLNERGENELSYWKYAARTINRAVSEPSIQTMCILGTRVLQKSNSFHDLNNFGRPRRKPFSVQPYKPKLVTWLYVTRAQCRRINFTTTDDDLLNVFHDIFRWTSPNETTIMARLFADVAKFCKNRDLADDKMSALLGIYFYTHLYNKSLDTVSYKEVYNFFKELIIHHSILIPPDRVRLFSTEDAKNILAHFLNKYLICLPLIRHICVPRSKSHVQQKTNDSNPNI